MKLIKNSSFTPITLTLTIETQEEAQALYAIFNHTDNQELLSEDIAELWKTTLGRQYYSTGVIANGITYGKFYPGKRRSF